MTLKTKLLTFALLAFFFGNAFAAENIKGKPQISQDKAIKNFIAWDKKLKTLDTFYTQEVSFEGTSISKTFGRILKENNLLRLDTLEDGKVTQYAITDKNIIKIFDEKNNPVMNMSWQSWQETQQNKSLFDFGNYENIFKEHKVLSFEGIKDGYTLILTPKEEPSYILTFVLDKNFFPKEIILINEGVMSKTTLQKTKINPNITKENIQWKEK